MTGLPADGARVTIWPMPDRCVQDGPRTLDNGGRWLKGAKEVVWSPFYLEQLRAGDILLHDPEPAEEPDLPAPKKSAPTPPPSEEPPAAAKQGKSPWEDEG